MIGKRTLTPILLAIGALVLGLVAQDYFWRFVSASTPADGLLTLAGAVVLFVFALRASLRARTWFRARTWCRARTWPYATDPASGVGSDMGQLWRLGGGILAFALAGVATFASLALFRDDLPPQLAWALYLLANVLFLAAVYILQPRGHKPAVPDAATGAGLGPTSGDRARRRLFALLAILALGAFFRLYRFAELPYGLWYDEADNGLWARQILANPDFRPIYVSSTNLPAHFLYLVALSFRLLGDSMYAIRAVAVLFGMLSIVAAYYCGRELGGEAVSGRAVGWMLAFLLAVSRWDVNWSRIGMHGVTVPFFELWAVASLLRGLRTGRLAAFGWAGLALGLGLCFYSPFRVFPVVLAGFLLAYGMDWLLQSIRHEPQWGVSRLARHVAATWSMPAAIYVLGVLVAAAPVVQYARLHPDLFWDRAKKISILEDPVARQDPVYALADSTSKHLLMFNYRGDPNGRHNLPGAPMLDRLSGLLMVFGGTICLFSLWDPRSVLLLLWLFIPLSGGILSTWFEAPQSLRSIGSLPAAYALACLPLTWFAGEWRRVFEAHRNGEAHRREVMGRRATVSASGSLVVLAVVLFGAIGLENAVTYFYLWGHDFSSWAAFSAAETGLAREVNRYRHTHELRFDPLLTAHLATRYLVPDYPVYHPFDPGTVFPLRGPAQSELDSPAGTVLFIAPDTVAVRRQAETLYPCGEGPCLQVETFAHPYSGNVVMYEYVFSQQVIASVQGLDARYMPLAGADVGKPGRGEVEQRVDSTIDFSWGGNAPDGRSVSAGQPPSAEYPFQATWTGGLLVPQYGAYTLHVELPGSFVLELDGREAISGQGAVSRRIAMAEGVHDLVLDGRVSGPGVVRLMWQTPTAPGGGDEPLHVVPGDALYRASWPTQGLVGRLYANGNWEGEPAQVRLDRQVAYYFHFLPLPRPYTVEWIGRLAAPAEGFYRLSVRAISGASLHLDGRMAIEQTSPGQIGEVEVYLTAGLHDIRIRYLDDQSHSQIYLYWQPPGAELTLVPPDALFPPAEGAWWPLP